MATEAQIAANRNNAQASTGPTSEAGRARSSRNALSSGLYSRGDFVLPGEHDDYDEFCASFHADLQPEGAVEQTLTAQIIHAAWRLRRCSAVEAGMTGSLDPMVDSATTQTQQAVDRARNDANRTFHRAVSELRRLQTERQFRAASFPADVDRRQLLLQKPSKPLFTNQTQSADTQTPRNSPCTCGSGIKFKRCCGRGAPPVLNLAA